MVKTGGCCYVLKSISPSMESTVMLVKQERHKKVCLDPRSTRGCVMLPVPKGKECSLIRDCEPNQCFCTRDQPAENWSEDREVVFAVCVQTVAALCEVG